MAGASSRHYREPMSYGETFEKDLLRIPTSICLRVLATSRGVVTKPAIVPATTPALKLALMIVTGPASGPLYWRSRLLICKRQVETGPEKMPLGRPTKRRNGKGMRQGC
jgi:hypothetical protein